MVFRTGSAKCADEIAQAAEELAQSIFPLSRVFKLESRVGSDEGWAFVVHITGMGSASTSYYPPLSSSSLEPPLMLLQRLLLRLHATCQSQPRLRQFGAQASPRQIGQGCWIALSVYQRVQHGSAWLSVARPLLSSTRLATAANVMFASFSTFWTRLTSRTRSCTSVRR
jgi:hypothetical protein